MSEQTQQQTENVDLFGDPIIKDELLRDKFMEPPFSILDGKGGDWQNRKRAWKRLGIESEQGRDAECMPGNFGGDLDENGLDKYGRKPMTATSVFDPALTELMYKWFCPPGGKILDVFAGGSVRGIVANYLGFKYTGLELRPEQVASNEAQATKILPGREPLWLTGDSEKTLQSFTDENMFDFLFTCPPYHDLEVYSDDPDDLSNMPYEQFLLKYERIISLSVQRLRPNSFAVIVVGDIRDKDGFYRNFNSHTKDAYIKAGAKLYNEAKLLQPLGTAMLRANKIFTSGKKLIKVHEDVLIFYKGDPKQIKAKFNL
jgi:DNA modification methylase